MHHELTLLEREAAHNLINLRVFPSPHLSLGQVERLNHGGATVRMERVGNLFTSGMEALTYRYVIAGAGFELVLLAIYGDTQKATAFITVQSVSPDPAETDGALLRWLLKLIDEKRTPSDPFFDELLLN